MNISLSKNKMKIIGIVMIIIPYIGIFIWSICFLGLITTLLLTFSLMVLAIWLAVAGYFLSKD